MIHDTQSAQISQKHDEHNIYLIMKTMCPPGYHHNGFLAMMYVYYVPKGMSCDKAIMVITRRVNCFHDNIYNIMLILYTCNHTDEKFWKDSVLIYLLFISIWNFYINMVIAYYLLYIYIYIHKYIYKVVWWMFNTWNTV